MPADRDPRARDLPEAPRAADVADGADARAGSLDPLDSTLPPTPLKTMLAADGASVFVLSADPDLLETVRQAAGEHYPLDEAADWPALVQAVREGRTGIVLLDADAVPKPLDRALAELESLADLVVLIAAARDEAQPLMGLLSERRIHRLLIKPPALGITGLLLESAVNRFLQSRDVDLSDAPADPDDTVQLPPEQIGETRRRARGRRSSPVSMISLMAGAALASVLVGVAWVGRLPDQWADPGRGGARAPATETMPAPEAAHATARAASARPRAEPDASLRAPSPGNEPTAQPVGDPSASPGDAARPTRRTPDPERVGRRNGGAAAPPVEETGRPETEAAESASGGAPDAVAPDDEPRTAPSAAAETDGAPAPAAVPSETDGAAPAEPPPELERYLALAEARLAAGRLLEPEGDSALAYIEQAEDILPFSPLVLEARTALASAVLAAARSAIDGGDLDRAQALAAEAFRLGAGRQALAELDSALEAAQQQRAVERHEAWLSAARTRLERGRLIEPAGDSARHFLTRLNGESAAVPGLAATRRAYGEAVAVELRAALAAGDWDRADEWLTALDGAVLDPELRATLRGERKQAEYLATPISAGALERLEAEPPVYPERARANGIEGWVELELVIDTEGRPREIAVTDARPRGIFDDAAVEAVATHRYRPFDEDGRLYERRAYLRVRFTLD